MVTDPKSTSAEDLDAEGFAYWPQEAQDAILRRDAEIERLREALRPVRPMEGDAV